MTGVYNLPEIEGVEHKSIKDFPNYQIYSIGQIWNRVQHKWKKFAKDSRGHLSVHLTNNGYSDDFQVHRLVYQAFVGAIPKGYVIHHDDFCPQNNHYSNLRIMTRADHTRLHKKGKVGANKGKQMTQQQKRKISQTLKKYKSTHSDSQQTRRKRSQNTKRIWLERKLKGN